MTRIHEHRRSPSAHLMESNFVSWDADTGVITYEFTPAPSFASPRGVVQGGLIGGFLDEVMGAALLAATDGDALPLNMDMAMTFIRPVPLETIRGTGRVVQAGRRVCFLEGELYSRDGELLARATSTAIPTEVPAPAK